MGRASTGPALRSRIKLSNDMSEQPFHILVIGDFSGRFSGDREAPKLTPQVVDRDDLDDVLKAMKVSLKIQGKNILFNELEDFHPDRIYQALGSFEDLDVHAPAPVAPGDLLSSILADQGDEEVAPDQPVRLSDADDLSGFVERITAGHVVPAKDPAQLKREADRSLTAAERMREILHEPGFQSIEAAWRGLDLLVRTVDTGADLKIYILDLTLAELVRHLDVLRESLKRKGPWAVIGANFVFGQSDVEVEALRRIAALAKAVEAPFIAEAAPPESSEPAASWAEFRKSPDAVWIGLALPRFLLRLPYGKETSPIDSFPFEEMPEMKHSDYLWGNPAFLCVSLLAQAFEASGWDGESIPRRVDGLPVHIYREDGEALAKPCAEVLMTQTDAIALLEAGVMPLVSIKGQDAVMLLRVQSVADPLRALPVFEN